MATNEVQGDLIGLFISSVLVTPLTTDWKEVLCNENLGLDGSRDVNTKRTKCGPVKGFGPPSWTVQFTGTYNTTPGTNKISAQELAAFFQNETPLLLKMVHATTAATYTRIITGQITKYTEGANTGDAVNYDVTFEGQGSVQLS